MFSLVGESVAERSPQESLFLRFLDPTAGQIIFQGKDITHLSQKELRPLKKHMQIIY